MPSGPEIAGNFQRYIGHAYGFGGAPGPDGSKPWDCSSAISWNLGHDFNMKLPGAIQAGYSGRTHGPVVLQYATWLKARTVAKPQAGVLCIWAGAGAGGHIGIATGPDHMISALNPSLGTIMTPIQGTGPAGVPLIFREITGVVMPNGCLA